MNCPRCQTENPPQAKFCLECAAPLARRCVHCGTLLQPAARFCSECAHPVAPAPPTPARFPSPESYTPKHLAEKILTSKAALEGERKQVTVLFADLKGSMELLADRDPEEARKLLDPVLERMMEAVHRYEGTVNQVMGDGIMALFGAPLAHEDHAVRACYAALDLQAALRRDAEQVRSTQGVTLQIRVGLNSGEVVVRAVGSDLRMDYSAVGQTTHLAARMEQLADPGSTLLTADTLRLAEGFIEVKPLGPVPVKGVDAPIEVYELVGAGPLRSRLQLAASRGLTRFVGRERELEQLRVALGQAATGRGQVVAMVGEPGVGKSRLVWELTHSHRTHGWLILEGGSVSYGKATPYLPVIALLKTYFRIQDRDEHREIREKVTGKVLILDDASQASIPAFLALLDVPVDEPQWQALDPPQRRLRTQEAVKRLLLRESQGQPLLVIVEDLHWMDAETQGLLDSIVDSVPTARILLLTTYRPEYQHAWSSRTNYTQMRLDPLPAENAQALLRTLLGAHPEVQPLKALLIERTEGNPFFLEEAVRTLVETRVLTGERGAYRVAKPVEQIQVPTTVQAVLAARIDRLPPDEKRLLQAAAVIGKDVPDAILLAIADRPEDELRRDLAHLQAAEFLYEARLVPDLEYTFKHALTHDVASGSLLQERRRHLHARIVDAIEQRYPGRLAEQIERLAHHAARGEVWDKAVAYLRQAGAKAATRSAYREAMTYFEDALSAIERLPRSPDTMAEAIDLRFDLRNCQGPLGTDSRRMVENLRAAEGVARELGDQRRLAWVAAHIANVSWAMGEYAQALDAARRTLETATALDDPALAVVARFRLGQSYATQGEYRRAIEALGGDTLDRATDARPGHAALPFLPGAALRTWLAMCHAELGEFAEGAGHAQDGLRLAEAANHNLSVMVACLGLGRLRLTQGDFAEAIPVLQRGLELSQLLSAWSWITRLASALGGAYLLASRLPEALPLLDMAVVRSDATNIPESQSLHLARLGEACLLAGRPGEAVSSGHRALELSRRHGERGHEAWSLRLLAEIAMRVDPLGGEMAEHRYLDALSLATELGMRPLVAHCHLGLGTLYRATADQARAQEPLVTAITMYREMDMSFWREQAEAAQIGAPARAVLQSPSGGPK